VSPKDPGPWCVPAAAPGDRAIVLRLCERLSEGAVLDAEALRALPWELSLLERLE